MPQPSPLPPIDLRTLVGHQHWIAAATPLEAVNSVFTAESELQFLPVLEGVRVIGICARRQVGVVLGARYGFALFSRKPVRDYLLKDSLAVRVDEPIALVLQRVFSRPAESFDDDVLLLDGAGVLIGTIFVHTLVRLQHEMLRANIQRLEEHNAEVERDLRMAGEVQLAMLPHQYPNFAPAEGGCELRFSHRYVPSNVVSGDFFTVLQITDELAGVFICDVMGHGVRAALIVAMLRALVEELRPVAHDPALMLARINHDIRMILRANEDPMFASAFYAVIQSATGAMRFSVAGHPPPIHVQRDAGLAAALAVPRRETGPALGIFDQVVYPVNELTLAPGDVFLLYTDGVFEVFAGAEEFGLARLISTVHEHRDLATERLLDRTLQTVRDFQTADFFEDDVCLLSVEFARPDAALVAAVQTDAEGPAERAAS